MTGQNFIQFPLLCQLPFSLSLSPKETGTSAGCTKNVANVTTWWLLFPQLRSSQRKENTSSRRWTQTKILSLCHVDRLLFHAFFSSLFYSLFFFFLFSFFFFFFFIFLSSVERTRFIIQRNHHPGRNHWYTKRSRLRGKFLTDAGRTFLADGKMKIHTYNG